MGTRTYHIDKAERNERFYQAQGLDKAAFNEWAVVVLFYTVLHYVDAVLTSDPEVPELLRDPKNHLARNSAVAQSKVLEDVAQRYLNLYNRGCDARYTQITFPDSMLSSLTDDYASVRSAARTSLRLK